MGQYTQTSLIFRSADSLRRYFLASGTYKLLCILLNWCSHSAINHNILKYLARNSSLKHSVFYRVCSKLFSFFDRLWDILFKFGVSCGNSSVVISFIKDSFYKADSFVAFALLVFPFSFAFGVTHIYLGTFNLINAFIMGIGIFVSFLLFLGKARWTAYLKSSIFWHFALYIFD